jgi:hypothetical protein
MIDLATAKNHLRVDGSDEDALIQLYLDAAVNTFETWTNRQLVADADPLPDPVGNALHATRSIDQGVLLLVGHWYANREAVTGGIVTAEMPMATRALWMPHRWVNL